MDKFWEKVTDGTHDTSKPSEYGHYLVTGKNIKNSQINFDSAYFIIEKDHKEISKRSGLKEWDILFSNIGTIGETAIVRKDPDYSVKNIIIFRPKTKFESLFLAHVLKNPLVKERMLLFSSGASQQFIGLGVARKYKILVPDSSRLRLYGERVIDIWKQLRILQDISKNLTLSRNMLLSRLISGKLSVEDLDIQFSPSMLEESAA